MRIAFILVVAVVAVLCLPGLTPAQEIFRTDPTRLERPVPLKTYKSGDAAKICDAIAKALTDSGFKVTNQDCDAGEFEATKKTRAAGESDRVLIWLERDFEKPKDAIKLYFRYGRYETLVGHPEPVRIVTTAADELQSVGALKDSLTSLKL
jgi:hypothetical protein